MRDTAVADWSGTIANRLAAEEVQIRSGGPGFLATQSLMGLRLEFDSSGARFVAGSDVVGLKPTTYGRESSLLEIAPTAPSLGKCAVALFDLEDNCVSRLEYAHDGLTEWWLSAPGFIQTGWDIETEPRGAGHVVIDVAVSGASVVEGANEDALEFIASGRTFPFEGLVATDDAGTVLDAWMEPTPTGLRVFVDAVDARWPIHVDPTTYTATWSTTGSSSARLGYAVGGGGDVNNDGYDDIVVGAPGYSTYTGRAYVFHGSATGVATSPASTMTGAAGNSYFGAAARIAGDVNNDGYDDVVIGAYNAGGYQGAAYVYHGSATGVSTTAATTLTRSGGYYAWAVSTAGDVNGDGYSDIIIGAPYYASYYGAAYLYQGSSSGIPTTPTTTFTASAYDYMGFSVTGGSDMNGDGYDDVAVSLTDKVKVFCGSATGVSTTACTTLSAPTTGLNYGQGTDFAGDVNSDGYDDLVVGMNTSSASTIYVYNGSITGYPGTATTTISGSSSSYFGSHVSGLGDINGDGYDDIAIGAYLGSGSVKVYKGSATGIDTSYMGEVSGSSLSQLGSDIDEAGDVNGDGYGDFIAGGPGAYSTSNGYAAVYGGSADADGDGYTPGTGTSDDCDDTNASIHPGATETTGDGVDYNCDGAETCYDDDDNDGYLDTAADTRTSSDTDCSDAYEGTSSDLTTDCSDSSASRYPGATEVVADGIDQDCDGHDACYDDDDNDGYLDTTGDTRSNNDSDCNDAYEGTTTDLTTDCDDSNSLVKPGATEITGDSVDQNCDGTETCYDDDDDDGYLDTAGDTRSSSDTDCSDAYEGTSSDLTTDCSDSNAARNPGAAEIVGDGVDEDCTSSEICYEDDDNDGYLDTSGDTRTSSDSDCADSYEGTSTDTTTDCDDASSAIKPSATEITGDEVDQNCDGAETCYDDDDDDGYLDTTADTRASSDSDCDDAYEASSADPTTDCDDANSAKNPAATETVGDGIDFNCDGGELCFDDDDDDGYLDTTADTRVSADADCSDAYEGGTSDVTTDCDDANAAVYPGATQLTGDEVDEDCDGRELCFDDDDDDAFLDTSGDTVVSSDADCDDAYEGESSTPTTDCDDADAAKNPAATETVGDELDFNCDGGELCFDDDDNDGYLDTSGDSRVSSDLDCSDAYEGTTATSTTDCDDANSAIQPRATEIVGDEIDSNCDGSESCFDDDDADGFLDGSGDGRVSADADCDDANEGSLAMLTTDCDDANATINPAAPEGVGDEIDSDCDGTEVCLNDDDGDGFIDTSGDEIASADADCADANEASTGTPTSDCDDDSGSVYPAAPEVTADGIDQDCDGGDTCFEDADLDTYGAVGLVYSADLSCTDAGESLVSTDCDDTDTNAWPGAPETTADAVDQDCDGGDICWEDLDLDGFGGGGLIGSADTDCSDPGENASSTDCDDSSTSVYPGAVEMIADEIDQNCDGVEDCYFDVDSDGFGDVSTVTGTDLACDELFESYFDSDCDAAENTTYPGAPEITGDGVDQDCDSLESCFIDADFDGNGSALTLTSANLGCDGTGESTSGDDCDDADGSRYVGASEIPASGVDEDCDGLEACYVDADGDLFGDALATTLSATLDCSTAGSVADATDCDDANVAIYPGADETSADGIDSDCDGTEACFVDEDADGHGTEEAILADLGCTDLGSSPVSDDCDDAEPLTYPGAEEIVADGIDEDCDGDELCFTDADADGFGSEVSAASANLSCVDAGESQVSTDCDDGDGTISPDGAEACNDVDDNCDGTVDEGLDCVVDDTGSKDEAPESCGCNAADAAGITPALLAMAALVRRRRNSRR